MLRLILSSDCNPRIEFSILGSGIKKFLILGYCGLVLRLHLSVISNVDKRMQALKVPLYPYHDIINYTNNLITSFTYSDLSPVSANSVVQSYITSFVPKISRKWQLIGMS